MFETESSSWLGTAVKTTLIFGAGMLAGALVNSMMNDEQSCSWTSSADGEDSETDVEASADQENEETEREADATTEQGFGTAVGSQI